MRSAPRVHFLLVVRRAHSIGDHKVNSVLPRMLPVHRVLRSSRGHVAQHNGPAQSLECTASEANTVSLPFRRWTHSCSHHANRRAV